MMNDGLKGNCLSFNVAAFIVSPHSFLCVSVPLWLVLNWILKSLLSFVVSHIAQDFRSNDHTTRRQMFGNNRTRTSFVNAAIPDAFRIDDHHGAAPALVQTFDLRHQHRAAQVVCLD